MEDFDNGLPLSRFESEPSGLFPSGTSCAMNRVTPLFRSTDGRQTPLAQEGAGWLERGWKTWTQDVTNLALLLCVFSPNPLPWVLVEWTSDALGWGMERVDEARCFLYDQGLIEITDEGCYLLKTEVRHFLEAQLQHFAQADPLQRAVEYAIAQAEQFVAYAYSESSTVDPAIAEDIQLEAIHLLPHISVAASSLAQ